MMRLRSLPPPVLFDAIEQLFSGCSVENVATAVRERLIGSGHSPDANLHHELLSLQLLVKAHAAANLAKIRENVLSTDISSVTEKCYGGVVAAESIPRSTTDAETPKPVTALEIIQLALEGIADRLESWWAIQQELVCICEGDILDLNAMTRAIHHGLLGATQEDWLRLLDRRSGTAGNAEQHL